MADVLWLVIPAWICLQIPRRKKRCQLSAGRYWCSGMHLKPAPHCLQEGCKAECTCRAEVSACSGPQKEHQDPNLPFYGAGNEPCSVSQHTQRLQSGWLWSTCSHRKCLLLVEPNGRLFPVTACIFRAEGEKLLRS